MKTRTIGQCKNCKYWITRDNKFGGCKLTMDGIYTGNFGCWFWKEKQ